MKTEKISFIIGTMLTLIITGVSYFYLEFKNSVDPNIKKSNFFNTLESLDLRFNDIKYKLRSTYKSEAPVALIAVDDDSLLQIGRWPWDRKLIAQLTEESIQLGAKTVAFDAIFSEPQKGDLENDLAFAEVVGKYPDKIVMGVFNEEKKSYLPYQDYCLTEAFIANNGAEIVKINPTFVVEDMHSIPFDEIEWGPLFSIFFNEFKKNTEQAVLASYNKKSIDELTEFQKNYLNAEKTNSMFTFCSQWLTSADPFLDKDILEKVIPLYKKEYSKVAKLKDLSFEDFKTSLIKSSITNPVPQSDSWTSNILELQVPSQYSASFFAKQDADGYVRRYPLFYRAGNKLGSSFIPSLALQTYLLSNNLRAEIKINLKGNEKQITSFNIYDTSAEKDKLINELPIDGSGQLLVNYYGNINSLPYIPAKEFFNNKDTMEVYINAFDPDPLYKRKIEIKTVNKKEFLKDRNLIFGATAVGVYDLRTVPIEANFPGPEIHLTMLANLLDGKFIKNWSQEEKLMPFIVLMIGVFLSLSLSYLGSIQSVIIVPAIFIISIFFDYFIFVKWNTLYSGILILMELSLISFAIIIYKYFTEEKKKRELKSTFSKYVSPAVVDELLKDVENLKLGGKRQRMTVFFSDVRGFTTISEKLTPEELSRVLNLYLTPMTEIVFKNNGTLDKYMGDAIMAFFGAPVPHKKHPHEACRCALQSIEKLWELQKEFESKGLPMIDIGIGLNTGDMSVGNMGSNIVQNYTVMGDSVNLGSRLEGINKEYGTRIIISEFTNEEVKNDFSTREVDRVKVKGKNEPVRIFELLKEGPLDGTQKEVIDIFNSGYQLYLQKNFIEAKKLFSQSFNLNNDPVSEVYIERCDEYLAEPPPENWDGVYVMKTK